MKKIYSLIFVINFFGTMNIQGKEVENILNKSDENYYIKCTNIENKKNYYLLRYPNNIYPRVKGFLVKINDKNILIISKNYLENLGIGCAKGFFHPPLKVADDTVYYFASFWNEQLYINDPSAKNKDDSNLNSFIRFG